jgi:hypothetical protein
LILQNNDIFKANRWNEFLFDRLGIKLDGNDSTDEFDNSPSLSNPMFGFLFSSSDLTF